MSFDALAPHYRWMEAVAAGSLLQRCRTRFLREAITARRVLVLGPGRGRFVRAVLDVNAECRMTLVDSSARMLERIQRDLDRRRVPEGRVTFQHDDIRTWEGTPGAFDVVASHFFLDCFRASEIEAIVPRVARAATDDARWLLSDFAVPERGWARWRARGIHAAMYGFFRATAGISAHRLTGPDPYLARAGFRLHHRARLNFGLLHADVWRRAP